MVDIIHPLYHPLRKGTKFLWYKQCDIAFHKVNQEITPDHALTHKGPTKPIILTPHGSLYGVGAVIPHTLPECSEKPIAFASHTLSESEQYYAQIDREKLYRYFEV
ncbi:fibronectin type III domain-containing 3B-like protein [Trichonephila clavipes]|nr:fibronectin type III domain-containing 3B-like protein [Trichonephila clavipes]